HRGASQLTAREWTGFEPGIHCKSTRRPPLPLHRLQAHHRRHTNGGRSLERSPRDAPKRTTASLLLRRRVWPETQSGDYTQRKRKERYRVLGLPPWWSQTDFGR